MSFDLPNQFLMYLTLKTGSTGGGGRRRRLEACSAVSESLKPCCWAEWDLECTKEHGSESVCLADGVGDGAERTSGEWCPKSDGNTNLVPASTSGLFMAGSTSNYSCGNL